MKTFRFHSKALDQLSRAFLIMLLLGVSGTTFAQEQSARLSDYDLGVGDKIRITVFGEDDLSMEVTLSDAGTFSYPFLGEIEVLGRSIGELSSLLTEGLLDGYLVSPNVSITVVEYRPFYIHGEVEEPGGYPYQPGLTLQRAVALAGGFTDRASSSKFYVLNEDATSESDKKRIELTSALRPGDTITIEESFF